LDKGTSTGMIDMTSSDLSELRGAGAITLFALASAVVLGIVFYGLNGGETQRTASAPPGQSAHAPADGNSSAGAPGVPRVNENGVKG
jgi:hypothetical protein